MWMGQEAEEGARAKERERRMEKDKGRERGGGRERHLHEIKQVWIKIIPHNVSTQLQLLTKRAMQPLDILVSSLDLLLHLVTPNLGEEEEEEKKGGGRSHAHR